MLASRFTSIFGQQHWPCLAYNASCRKLFMSRCLAITTRSAGDIICSQRNTKATASTPIASGISTITMRCIPSKVGICIGSGNNNPAFRCYTCTASLCFGHGGSSGGHGYGYGHTGGHGRQRRHQSHHGRRKSFRMTSKENPYTVLGISETSTFDEVRRAFVQLALQHHPDVQQQNHNENNENDEHHHAMFIRIRKAFESIRKQMHGKLDSDNNEDEEDMDDDDDHFSQWSAEELREWYRNEWGAFNMTENTRQEIIHVYRTMSQGGKDKGGYWEMARQLSERDTYDRMTRNKNNPNSSIKRLTAAAASNATSSAGHQQPDDSLRARRRRRR